MADMATTCGCGCGSMTAVTNANEACGCGCECCGTDSSKSPEQEISELKALRESIDRRLADLS